MSEIAPASEECKGRPICSDTFFASCSQFPEVLPGDQIPTEPFLLAARGIVHFVEFLGTVFSPVRSDINGNIEKLTAIYEKDPKQCENLSCILANEKKQIEEGQFKIGTDALLWLKRAIEYIKIFLTLFVQDFDSNQKSSDLSNYFGFAYEATLKKYHGWFVQKIFGLCLHAAPGRKQLIKLLIKPISTSGDNKDELSPAEHSEEKSLDEHEVAVFAGIKLYLKNLEDNIEAIHRIYDVHGVDYKN